MPTAASTRPIFVSTLRVILYVRAICFSRPAFAASAAFSFLAMPRSLRGPGSAHDGSARGGGGSGAGGDLFEHALRLDPVLGAAAVLQDAVPGVAAGGALPTAHEQGLDGAERVGDGRDRCGADVRGLHDRAPPRYGWDTGCDSRVTVRCYQGVTGRSNASEA